MQRFLKPLTFALILLFFLIFTSMPLWDPDFWWHINTGRYIVENRALPDEDPFSFTTPEGHTLRKEVLLRRYWLSQIILYLVYRIGGVSGVILLRSLVLTITLLLIYHLLRNADPYLRLLSIALTGGVLIYFTGERPQTLTFPLVIIMFILLEDYRLHRSRKIFLLPLVTLLWSNLHGSVLFAMGIITIYLFAISLESFTKRPGNRRVLYSFVAVCGFSLITSLLAPVGIIKQIISFYHFRTSLLHRSTVEFISPLKAAIDYGKYFSYYWVSLFIVVCLLILKSRRLSLSTIMITISTIGLGLIGARYMVFFILSTPLLFNQPYPTKRSGLLRYPALIISAVVMTTLSITYLSPFNFTIRSTYPVEAVKRFKDTGGSRIFTYLEWGGFVAYNIPDSRVFIDGRTLDEDVFVQYNTVLEGTEFRGQKEWQWILNHFNVDMVILPWRDPLTGMPLGIIERLLKSAEWKMVYFNENEAVFRKG